MTKEDGCIAMLENAIDSIVKLRGLNCMSEKDFIHKIDQLLDEIFQIYMDFSKNYSTSNDGFLVRDLDIPQNINNIIIYPDLYGELSQILLPKIMSKIFHEDDPSRRIPVTRLRLSIESSFEEKLNISLYSNLDTYSYVEKIDSEWRNIYVLGDYIKIVGRTLPFFTFIQEYIEYIDLIPEIQIKNVSLNGILLYRGTPYVPGVYDINASVPIAFINSDVLSRGSIIIKINPIDRNEIFNLLEPITKGYIFPAKYRLNKDTPWPLRHILLNFTKLIQPYKNTDSRSIKDEIRQFFTQLIEYSTKHVGLLALRTSGKTNIKLITPKDSIIHLYWYCRYGQKIQIDSEERTCNSKSIISFNSGNSDKTIIALIDSSEDIFSLINKKPIITIITE